MKRMQKYFLVFAVLAGMLGGCMARTEQHDFRSDNEIYTYTKVDPKKTQIVVSRTGNINVESLCIEFEKQNPDVNIIYLDITGGNDGYAPLRDWVMHGYVPDVVFTTSRFLDDEMTKKRFENLSANPIIQNYKMEALQRTATENDIYWLPGPSDISAMIYNRTLFEEYGWQIPATFDDFVALCDQIKEDTNGEVEPWNPNAKYSDELTTALECITYGEIFAGVDNYAWYNGLWNGESKLTGHMNPYTDVIQTLIDHDILRKEHFSYSATTRSKEFSSGKIAMINASIYNADNDEFDFGYMPFPTTKGQRGYLCNSYSCFFGVTVKGRSKKETEAIRRFLNYFSSPEGQTTYIGNSIKVSNVTGVSFSDGDDLSALQPVIDAGNMFTLLNFVDPITKEGWVSLHQIAIRMVIDGKSGQESLTELDHKLAAPMETLQPEIPEVVATVKSKMTILETSFYIANAYRSAMEADIGLIANNDAFRGNVMCLFAGDVTPDVVTVLKPRSFANESVLIKVSMTGQQLIDALNHPVGHNETTNCIYAFSGLKCEVAPWNELGSKYLSIKQSDGSELIADKLYTVAIWEGTISDAYITKRLASYHGTWEEMMTAQMREDKTLVPTKDGRIKLVWD